MKLLFQGDSVTDCGRDRGRSDDSGTGYVAMIARALKDTGETILNKGVSGDRVRDLETRWDDDCVSIRPDVLTILIGINDVWRQFDSGMKLDTEVFELTYQRLIDRAAPAAGRIILMEPFLIPAVPDKEPMRKLLDSVIQIIRTVARRNRLAYVPLDGLFAAACCAAPPAHLAEDGVHPSPVGHRLIADAWLGTYQTHTPSS